MKLVTFRLDGRVRHGQLIEDGTVVQPLGHGDLGVLVTLVHEANENALAASGPALPLADVEVLAPLLRPGKLLAVATNHHDQPLDKSPRLFLKPPTSIAGPGADIPLPTVGKEIDCAAQLGVVIGAVARDVPVTSALDIVGGYLTANEVSAVGDGRFFDWLAGKWLDGRTPMGPRLVTPDEVPDPQDLEIILDVNGKRRQHGNTRDMSFSVAELVSFASTLMTLEPGDVLLTGSPTGVRLAAGDEMSATVGGLGTLTNRVVAPGER